jgi:protein-tyrosine phosphatase
MAAAYFIAQGMSVDEALALIKQTRPFIAITPPQLQALHEYAKAIAEKRVGG